MKFFAHTPFPPSCFQTYYASSIFREFIKLTKTLKLTKPEWRLTDISVLTEKRTDNIVTKILKEKKKFT